MLAKLTCRGPHLRQGGRAGAAGGRGVPDPRRLHQHPVPAGRARRPGLRRPGGVTTVVHRDPPAAAAGRAASGDRGTKLLTYLADVTVNQPHGAGAGRASTRRTKLPDLDLSVPAPDGSRQLLLERRARRGSRGGCASRTGSAVTDTTFRDAHQSLLATRVRTRDLLAVAGHVARIDAGAVVARGWGGATYDVALRFLAEDPWERLAALRQAVPNICLQMLLRGRNTVGYTPYPTEVTDAFVAGGRRDRHRRLPDLRRAQRRRADAAGDRGGARDRDRRSPRSRSATPATCPTRTRSSTRSTTTCGSPSGSSTPARTCWRSRTWPGCCARRRRAPW